MKYTIVALDFYNAHKTRSRRNACSLFRPTGAFNQNSESRSRESDSQWSNYQKISKGAHTIVNANEAMLLITGGSRTSESGDKFFPKFFDDFLGAFLKIFLHFFPQKFLFFFPKFLTAFFFF